MRRILITDADWTGDTITTVVRGAVPQAITGLLNGTEYTVVNTATSGVVTPTGTVVQLEFGEWAVAEATSDAETRRVTGWVSPTPPAGWKWQAHVGPAPEGNLSQVQDLVFSVGNSRWEFTAPTASGAPGAAVYVRIALARTDNLGSYWAVTAENARRIDLTNTPAPPTLIWRCEVDGTAIFRFQAHNGRGRPVTTAQYSVDAGATWTSAPTVAVGTDIPVSGLSSTAPVTTLWRTTSVNGTSANASVTVLADFVEVSGVELFATGDVRVGAQLGARFPSGYTRYSTFLETIPVDRVGSADLTREPCLIPMEGPGHQATIPWGAIGMMIRLAVARFNDTTGAFVDFTYSPFIGPVDYPVGYNSDIDIVVTTQAGLASAVANNAYRKIAIGAGATISMTGLTALSGRNREAVPLTITSQSALNMGTLDGGNSGSTCLDMLSARSITIECLRFRSTVPSPGGSMINTNGTRNVTIRRNQFLCGNRIPDADLYYPGIVADTNWSTTQRYWLKMSSNQINLTVEDNWVEHSVGVQLKAGQNQVVQRNRVNGTWYDIIRLVGDSSYLDRTNRLTQNLFYNNYAKKDEAGILHPDQIQFFTGRHGTYYIDQHFGFCSNTRARGDGAVQGFFNAGSGIYRGHVRGSIFVHSAQNGYAVGVHRDLATINTLVVSEVHTDRTNIMPLNWGTNRAIDDYAQSYRVFSGFTTACMFRLAAGSDPFDAATQRPLEYAGAGFYSFRAAGAENPFMADTGKIYFDNPRENFIHYRARPGYEQYGALTPEGYMKPLVPLCPAPVITGATRSGSNLNVTFTASAGATFYYARWRIVGGKWYHVYYPTTTTSVTIPNVSNDAIEVNVYPVGADQCPGEHSAIFPVAGLLVAPTLEISAPTLGAEVGVPLTITTTVTGYPAPTVAPSAVTFGGVAVALEGGPVNWTYTPASAGTLSATFTATNSAGTAGPTTVSVPVFAAAPATTPTISLAANANQGELVLTVSGTMPTDAAELVMQFNGTETVLSSPPATGTRTLTSADGVVAGTAQTVQVFFRNVVGNGTAASATATSSNGTGSVTYATDFVGRVANTNITTMEAASGVNWTSLSTANGTSIVHSNTLGMRLGGSSSTLVSISSAGARTIPSTGIYLEADIYNASNSTTVSTRLIFASNADGSDFLAMTITSSAIIFQRVTAGSGTTLATYSTTLTVGSTYTIRAEILPTSQAFMIGPVGAPVQVLTAASNIPSLTGLGNLVGLGFRATGGTSMSGPAGKLILNFEAGTL